MVFDSSFNLSSFINSKNRNSNIQLFRIRRIRKSWTFLTNKTIVNNPVLLVINYCIIYILLSGLPVYKIKLHESILRLSVRVVFDICWMDIQHCEKNKAKNNASIFILQSTTTHLTSFLDVLIQQNHTCHTRGIKSTSQYNINQLCNLPDNLPTPVHLNVIRYNHRFVLIVISGRLKEN